MPRAVDWAREEEEELRRMRQKVENLTYEEAENLVRYEEKMMHALHHINKAMLAYNLFAEKR